MPANAASISGATPEFDALALDVDLDADVDPAFRLLPLVARVVARGRPLEPLAR